MKDKHYQLIFTTPLGIFKSKIIEKDDLATFMFNYNAIITEDVEGFVKVPFLAGNGSDSAIWLPRDVLRNSVIEVIEI